MKKGGVNENVKKISASFFKKRGTRKSFQFILSIISTKVWLKATESRKGTHFREPFLICGN